MNTEPLPIFAPAAFCSSALIGGSSSVCDTHAVELICHHRVLCNSKADGWDSEEGCDAMFLAVFQEVRKGEFGHPEYGPGIVEGVDEVPLDTGYMGRGKMGESADLEVRFVARGVCPAVGVRGYHSLRNDVTVGEADTFRGLVSLALLAISLRLKTDLWVDR